MLKVKTVLAVGGDPTPLIMYQHTVTRGAENILNVNEKKGMTQPKISESVVISVMFLSM